MESVFIIYNNSTFYGPGSITVPKIVTLGAYSFDQNAFAIIT